MREPLSHRERTALVRILGNSARESLAPRQRAALDAYASVLSSPPLVQSDVVAAARAMIRIWAEIGAARRPKKKVFQAELLDLDDVLYEPGLSPTDRANASSVFDLLAADLLEDPESERPTELLEPLTPDWTSTRHARVRTTTFARP